MCFAVATASLYFEPVVWTPAKFAAPLNPLTPCLGILANVILITSLGPAAWIRWAIWFLVSMAWYLTYGVHNSRDEGSYGMHMELGSVRPREALSPVWEGTESEAYTSARDLSGLAAGRRSPAITPSSKGASRAGSSESLSLGRGAGSNGSLGGNGNGNGNGLLLQGERSDDALGDELPEA